MSVRNRVERSVRRGYESEGLWMKRSQKQIRSFDRWFAGLMLKPRTVGGMLIWERLPSGRGLIHNGRKP